jgi:steroid delta-isomerase-like uncharacterized protein
MTALTENKDIVTRCMQCFDKHDLDGALALVADDLVNHAAVPAAQGAMGMRRIMEKLFEAAPDQRMLLEDVIAEGDRVVCRVVVEGTNTGPLPFAALATKGTGKRFKTEQIHVFRIANGKIVEHWGGRDDIGMLRQLGLPPFGT